MGGAINAAGFLLHGVLLLAAVPLMAGKLWGVAAWPGGRMFWALWGFWALLLLDWRAQVGAGIDVELAPGWTRLVIVGGVVGAYHVARVLPVSWSLFGLRAASWVVPVLAMVNAVTDTNRMGIFFNQNQAAALVLLCAPWNMEPWMRLPSAAALLLTQSRGGALGAGVAWATRRGWISGVMIGAPIVAVALIAIRPGTVAYRFDEWERALSLWQASPLTRLIGAGTGALEAAGIGVHADSLPITVLAENGLLGIAVLGIVGIQAAAIVMRAQHPARWGLLAWAIMEATDATVFWPWAGLAAAVSVAALERESEWTNNVND